MRLFLSTLALALMLGGSALAAPPGPDPPVAPSQTPAAQDLRAPDQIRTPRPVAATTDLRAPDQQAPAPVTSSAPASDGGPAAIVLFLIGVGAALVLLTGVYFAARWRHRLADADNLAVTH